MQKILLVDPERCSGCRACESVCSLRHANVCNPARARIHVVKWEMAGIYIPVVCQQCDAPLCENVCPMRAFRRDARTGAVLVDYDLCVGCKLCVAFCPLGSISLDVKTGKVVKCDLCDGEPMCVRFCEPRALQYLNADAVNVMRRRAAAERFSELMKKMLAIT